MYRHIFRFAVTTLTILTANLITTVISDYVIGYKSNFKPLAFTLLSMGIIVLIFYPLFMKVDKWVNKLSVRIIRSGRSLAGKYLGLFLAFITALFILTFFYARMWYDINIFSIIFHGNLRSYI
ncbi:MAG TPA: hypothetical protein PLI41_00980 [Bacteroidales bacterium]|jgi:hypothetical protein|nr:hypothetical protein [Bacteroidales bacterium]HQB36093.1 hypothetical protein [Bacteroidales bacterium]